MSYTPSRFFEVVDGNKLKIVAAKTAAGYYTKMDHPVLAGFIPADEEEINLANREYLQAVNQDFWKSVPEADEQAVKKAIVLKKDLNPLLKEDWIRLIKLYSHFCSLPATEFDQQLEAGCLFVVENSTLRLRVLIPKQEVSKVVFKWSTVNDFLNKTTQPTLMFLDGTSLSFKDFQDNYTLLGVNHSHNTMRAFPSHTDDTCEVKDAKGKFMPSGFHMILGGFSGFQDWENVEPDYEIYASLAHLGIRQVYQDWMSLIEEYNAEDWKSITFDKKVLDLITKPKPVYTNNWWRRKPAPKTPQTSNSSFYSGYIGGYPSSTSTSFSHNKPPYTGTSKVAKFNNSTRALEGWKNLNDSSVIPHNASNEILEKALYEILEDLVDHAYLSFGLEPVDLVNAVVEQLQGYGELTEGYSTSTAEVEEAPIDTYIPLEDAGIPTDEEIIASMNLDPEEARAMLEDPFYTKES